MRNRGQIIAWLVAVALLVAGALYLAARNTHRGTSLRQRARPAAHQGPNLGQASAHDYDPLGDHKEHPNEVKLVVDSDPNTYWTTETYQNGNLASWRRRLPRRGPAGAGLRSLRS